MVDLSDAYFSRVFRQTFGEAPRAWLVRQRITRAALALDESTRSITEIAHQMATTMPSCSAGNSRLSWAHRRVRIASGIDPAQPWTFHFALPSFLP